MNNIFTYAPQRLSANQNTLIYPQNHIHLHSPILNFNHQQYPFPNSTSNFITSLETVVNVSLIPQKLDKIVRLNHPNIIGIRKIVKSRTNQPLDLSIQKPYSFYYQLVNFSLLFLSEKPQTNPRLSSLLFSCNLGGVLNSVVEYLQDLQIHYKPRLQDIGISLEGNIKLFISPVVIFQSNYQAGVKRTLHQISQWWENYLRMRKSNIFKKEKKQLQPPQLLSNNHLEIEEPNIPESIIQKELGDLLAEYKFDKPTKIPLKSSTNSLSKVGTQQIEKIKMIDQEVKFIRERLSKKQPKNTINQMQKLQIQETNKNGIMDYQLKLIKHQQYFRQPIQQNINCINIYNHNNHISPPTQNSNDYKPLPYIKNQYFDPQYIRQHQEDEESQDTYDLQFDNAFDNAEPVKKNMIQHNRGRERELSQYSVQIRKKKNQGLNKASKKNKIVCNKNYTESAGPLEFKSLMGRFLLPETQQTNKESSRIAGQIGKKQATTSISNYTPQSIRSATIDKTIKQIAMVKNTMENVSEKKRADKIKGIHSQNQLGYKALKSVKQSEIEQKVRKALQKTKNAIALLNRVKSMKQVKK